MRKLFIGLIVFATINLVIFSTIPVYSATIDQVFYNSWTTGSNEAGWKYQYFSLFDGSLGTLNRVDIDLDYSLSNITPVDQGVKICVRTSFDWWFNNIGNMLEGEYHRTWSITKDSVEIYLSESVPGEWSHLRAINTWIGSSGTQGIFYQDTGVEIADDFNSQTFYSTAHLTYDYTPAPVPEPSTMLLLGSGLVGLVGYGRRRFKK